MNCRICEKDCLNYHILSEHLRTHKVTSKAYYDKFIGGRKECVVCGKETEYLNLNKGYRLHCSCKCRATDPLWLSKFEEVSLIKYGVKHPYKSDVIKNKRDTTCIERYGVSNPMKVESILERQQETAEDNGVFEKIKQRMLNGGAARANAFVKSPSKPQVELFNKVKSLYEDAILNYPCLNYSIDVAIPSLKVAIEYDSSYWHNYGNNKENDKLRQDKLETLGWKVVRYTDQVPSLEDIQKNVGMK